MGCPVPSPLGRVPPKGAGEVQQELAGSARVRRNGTALFRHGLRRATFPFGEGIYFQIAFRISHRALYCMV